MKYIPIFIALVCVVALGAGTALAQDDVKDRPNAMTIIKERVQMMRDKVMEAKDQYQEAQDNYTAARMQLKRANTAANRALFIDHAKRFVVHGIERMLNHIEVIRDHVEANDKITESEKALLGNKLDEFKTSLESQKTKAENATTVAELRTISQDTKKIWDNVIRFMKRTAALILNGQLQRLFDRADQISAKAQEEITALEAAGKDITAAKELLATYNDQVAAAKQKYAQAKDLFVTLDSENPGNETVMQIRSLIKGAGTDLRAAAQTLKDLHKELRALQPREETQENETA